jgi:hypothetical protein
MEQNHDSFAPEAPALAAASSPSDTLPALAAHPPALQDSFDPVLLRHRHDGWTPARQRAFIEALADTFCVAAAAERVGMSERSAYALRRRTGAGGFSATWDAALRQGFRHRVSSIALDKAVNGTIVRRYYHGALIAEERVYSERLLLRLLAMGEKLFGGGDAESNEVLADWDGAMARLESGALEGGYRIWRDRWGNRMTNFPPPPGFDNYEGEPADPDFERTLSEAEEEALAAQQTERVAEGEKARDLFFGFSPRGRAKDRNSRLKGGR